MTATRIKCQGCASRWWQWQQCQWGGVGGSVTARVEEATTKVAEEADDGPLDATPSLMIKFGGGGVL
jgi:hypothetical protein